MTSAACAKRTAARIPPPPAAARIGSTETGEASWYGAPYDGRRAASGEIYDMEKLTAAHRTLPFDTWVEVTNLSNGKQVDVRINDRGPFKGGRIIDLSHAAAREVGMLGPGTARVRLKVIQAPPIPATAPESVKPPVTAPLTPPVTVDQPVTITQPEVTGPATEPSGGSGARLAATPPFYAIQTGAFLDRTRAETLQRSLAKIFADVRVVKGPGDPPLWRVLVGSKMTIDAARQLAGQVVKASGGDAILIPEP